MVPDEAERLKRELLADARRRRWLLPRGSPRPYQASLRLAAAALTAALLALLLVTQLEDASPLSRREDLFPRGPAPAVRREAVTR